MWRSGNVENSLKESTSSMTTFNSRIKTGITAQFKTEDSSLRRNSIIWGQMVKLLRLMIFLVQKKFQRVPMISEMVSTIQPNELFASMMENLREILTLEKSSGLPKNVDISLVTSRMTLIWTALRIKLSRRWSGWIKIQHSEQLVKSRLRQKTDDILYMNK